MAPGPWVQVFSAGDANRGYVDFAFQVIDILVLSMQAQKVERAKKGKNPFADRKKVRAFDSAVFDFLGENVQMHIDGAIVDPDDQDHIEEIEIQNRSAWFFGELEDFKKAYLALWRGWLDGKGKKQSKWILYTRAIWLRYADEGVRVVPIPAR